MTNIVDSKSRVDPTPEEGSSCPAELRQSNRQPGCYASSIRSGADIHQLDLELEEPGRLEVEVVQSMGLTRGLPGVATVLEVVNVCLYCWPPPFSKEAQGKEQSLPWLLLSCWLLPAVAGLLVDLASCCKHSDSWAERDYWLEEWELRVAWDNRAILEAWENISRAVSQADSLKRSWLSRLWAHCCLLRDSWSLGKVSAR